MREDFTNLIRNDLADFNKDLIYNAQTSVKEFEDVLSYIFDVRGKQFRVILGILLCHNLSNTFTEDQCLFLQAIELIHNATLFHDDIIDNSVLRRNRKSLHEKFTNKIAVLAGDYLLSVGIKNIYRLKNMRINGLLSEYMKQICEGELEQNYSLNKLISIDEYISKTRKKTALLFALTTAGVALLSENQNVETVENCKKFGEYFGILFQLKDDLNNFKQESDKPVLNDLKDGVITAPVIFLAEEFSDINNLISLKKYDDILAKLNNSNAFQKTQNLIEEYYNKAQEYLNLLPVNIYKDALDDLLSEFGK